MTQLWEYMTDKAVVMPFTEGSQVYRDGMLSHLYYETQSAGRLSLVFCGDVPTHDEFIRMFAPDKKVLQVLCEVDEKKDLKPVGYCWVEMPKGVDNERAALCGFAFFKPSRQVFNLGMLGIAYWMTGLKINVIHGVMLAENKMAIKYAEKLGFVPTAIVPKFHFHNGKLVSALVATLDIIDFLPVFRAWAAKNGVAVPE